MQGFRVAYASEDNFIQSDSAIPRQCLPHLLERTARRVPAHHVIADQIVHCGPIFALEDGGERRLVQTGPRQCQISRVVNAAQNEAETASELIVRLPSILVNRSLNQADRSDPAILCCLAASHLLKRPGDKFR